MLATPSTDLKLRRKRGVGVSFPRVLLVRVDRAFVLGGHFIALPPLPVVVTIVVDLLDRDRRFSRDVVQEVVWSLLHFVLVYRLLKTSLSFLVLGERFSVRSNLSELLRGRLVERIDDLRRKFRRWSRGFVGRRLLSC